jgi:hypothetical protein
MAVDLFIQNVPEDLVAGSRNAPPGLIVPSRGSC